MKVSTYFNHESLDKDEAIQEEVRNAARTLLQGVRDQRAGRLHDPTEGLTPARTK